MGKPPPLPKIGRVYWRKINKIFKLVNIINRVLDLKNLACNLLIDV